MTFTYTARDPLGKLIQGELDAATRDEASQRSGATASTCSRWKTARPTARSFRAA